MAGTPIGRVLLIPQGDYNGATTYNMLDCVRDNGATWVCKVDGTVGIAPPTLPTTSNANWQLMAADGAVTGSVNWNNVNYKPFDTIGNGLNVTVTDELELDTSMLVASNLSYDNTSSGASSNDVQGALDELFRGGGGGGLLPYFYIDSEAGATVTVTAPDGSTITPTASGSGHWECSVPMYGTYVIHSVLAGQGDATASVTVDDVKEYHITDNHYDFTINVTAPSGSTIRITGGGETYTGTGTGSSQAFAVHTASTTYTVAVTMDGNTKTDTITSAATTGGSGSVSIEFGTITVSVDAAFVTAGSSITCVNGGTSCTAKTAASTVTFNPPTTGTWTISGSISGTPYSTTATVSSLSTAVTANLQTVPDGSTATPTDVIQTWLNCAGIYNKTSYTTLADVLADSTTLLALMSDNNAVDYLVRSTTWISDICGDSTAMTDIGANNYCADTLLADSDWCEGIIKSTYYSSVLNVEVPHMLNDTSPSGVASASSVYSGKPAYLAFDKDKTDAANTNYWNSSAALPQWLAYEFTQSVLIKAFVITPHVTPPSNYEYATKNVDLIAYDTSLNDWETIESYTFDTDVAEQIGISSTNTTKYSKWGIRINHNKTNDTYAVIPELELFGREDV